ncbi:MAG: hypothetical protein J3Q66DRAFT_330160 [Benniella sp.]|nr:MAG: hypothetical protein J3Q66DRAFT_330160 [Benniella sp.]
MDVSIHKQAKPFFSSAGKLGKLGRGISGVFVPDAKNHLYLVQFCSTSLFLQSSLPPLHTLAHPLRSSILLFNMKLLSTVALIALGAGAANAQLSATCDTYTKGLLAPTNPLAKCRVYTALGFPGITGAGDHDTVKLQKALTEFCASPACTKEQYESVYKDINTNCAADMVPANKDLNTIMYMWYMSPAQREAVCTVNPATNATCVIESINQMIARKQLPNDNKNEDDLYGYLQYVTPMASAKGTDAKGLCTDCNQEIANIFSNYYAKTPAPYKLELDTTILNNDLLFQYKTNCKATLGVEQSFLPKAGGDSGKGKDDKGKDTKSNGAQLARSIGGVAAAAIAVAVAMV